VEEETGKRVRNPASGTLTRRSGIFRGYVDSAGTDTPNGREILKRGACIER
jgi:hypothetical protein